MATCRSCGGARPVLCHGCIGRRDAIATASLRMLGSMGVNLTDLRKEPDDLKGRGFIRIAREHRSTWVFISRFCYAPWGCPPHIYVLPHDNDLVWFAAPAWLGYSVVDSATPHFKAMGLDSLLPIDGTYNIELRGSLLIMTTTLPGG